MLFSYLALAVSGKGPLHVSWCLSCRLQVGELGYDAQASDKVLTLQQSIYSFLLLICHDILGLCGVDLHVLCLGKGRTELRQR